MSCNRIYSKPTCQSIGLLRNRDLQEKSPTVLEVETVGRAFLFFGGFEEDCLRPACHSKPSMVDILPILSGISTEKYTEKYK
jgi:hypothetical protein